MKQLDLNFNVDEPRMRVEPYPHQLTEYNEHTFDKARALFWYMRTGKSKTIIDQACRLFEAREINTLLIIAPNGVHENWAYKEIPKHIWSKLLYDVWVWNTVLKEHPAHIEQLRNLCKYAGLRIATFPSSTLVHPLAKKYLAQVIAASSKESKTTASSKTLSPTLVCFDESHDFRTPGSKRTKWARAFSKRCAYRRILTGTPDLNSLLHYYSQLELLQPQAFGFKRFDDFKNRYAEYEVTNLGYPRLMGYKNIPELKQKVEKFATVVRREDCPYLSAVNREVKEIKLHPRQIKAQEVLNAKVIEKIKDIPEDDTFAMIGEIERSYIKHQQIASGYIGGRNAETNAYEIHRLISDYKNPKLQAVLQEIDYTTDQVIVWAQFRHDIETICSQLQQRDITHAAYYGKVSNEKKRNIRNRFDKGKIRVFVGQPQSAGLGLDLSASAKIIWYSHTRNTIVRSQANERATSTKNAFIDLIDFEAKPIDSTILKALDMNINISDYIANTPVDELIEELKLK